MLYEADFPERENSLDGNWNSVIVDRKQMEETVNTAYKIWERKQG